MFKVCVGASGTLSYRHRCGNAINRVFQMSMTGAVLSSMRVCTLVWKNNLFCELVGRLSCTQDCMPVACGSRHVRCFAHCHSFPTGSSFARIFGAKYCFLRRCSSSCATRPVVLCKALFVAVLLDSSCCTW